MLGNSKRKFTTMKKSLFKIFFASVSAMLLLACSYSQASVKELKATILKDDGDKGIQAARKVATLKAKDADSFVELIDQVSGDKRYSLIYSLGVAKSEKARPIFLDIIANTDDDFDSLSALWALELLPKKSDTATIEALFSAFMSKRARSKEYAAELISDNYSKDAIAFMRENINGEDPYLTHQTLVLAGLCNATDVLGDIFAACERNRNFIPITIDHCHRIITAEYFDEFMKYLVTVDNFQRFVKNATNAAIRLDKYGELKSFMLKTAETGSDKQIKSAEDFLSKMPPRVPLLAMCTAVLDWSKGGNERETMTNEKVKLLAKLGYVGVQPELSRIMPLDQLPNLYRTMRFAGVRNGALYIGAHVKEDRVDAHPLKTIFKVCRPFSTNVWLAMPKDQDKNIPRDNNEVVNKFVQNYINEAAHNGLDISIYPHINFFFDNAKETLEYLKENGLDSKNMFVTFNLIHEFWHVKQKLKDDSKATPEYMAKFVLDNKDKINIVTICGINIHHSISPLGEKGGFDTEKFVKLLLDGGYKGDIGVQGFGIWGQMPIEDALKISMENWRKWFD